MFVLIAKGKKLVEQSDFRILICLYDFRYIIWLNTSGDYEFFETDKSRVIHIKLLEKPMPPKAIFLEKHKEYFLFNLFISVSQRQVEVNHFEHVKLWETD